MKATDIWEIIEGEEVFFIAEIGKGFISEKEEKSVEEYLLNAKHLIDKAKEAGASAVKFQTHRVEDEQLPIKVMSPHFKEEDRYLWVKRNTDITPDWFWEEIRDYCKKEEIIFFSTPMSRGAAQTLEDVGMELWKVGSGDILDFVMLDYIRRTDKPIIISSGMSTLAELDKALQFILEKNNRVALLHCVSKYPCPVDELNVGTIEMLKNKFNLPVGFSDHSIGFEGVLQAVKCGATVIEKHFSLSRSLWGSDHKVSMIPEEFADMVQSVKKGVGKRPLNRSIIGEVDRGLQDGQSEFRPLFRKSLVAACHIPVGTRITPEMVYAMRPQKCIDGLPSEEYTGIIDRETRVELNRYDPINYEAVWENNKVQQKNLIKTG